MTPSQRRRRSDRRFNVLLAVVVVLFAGVLLTASLLQALHHGHARGLTTNQILWGV